MTTEDVEKEAARAFGADAMQPAAAAVVDINRAAAATASAQPSEGELASASVAAATVVDPVAAAKVEDKTAEIKASGDAYYAAGKGIPDADAVASAQPPSDPSTIDNNAPKRAKKKFALFVAYVGAGFSGMQYNKDQPTIEGTLRDALVAAGLISHLNADAFSKVAWSRAARTDKGVSAVGQVVALRLLVPTEAEGGEAAIAALVNAQLPPGIRVLGASKVRNGFDARKSCDRRRYEYVLPEFAFDPTACCARADERQKKKETEDEGKDKEEREGAVASEVAGAPPAEKEEPPQSAPAAAAPAANEEGGQAPEQQEKSKARFVFDDAAKARLNSILSQYEGTHK